MNIDIPSNNHKFQLRIDTQTTVPSRLRIVAFDPYKKHTKYADFYGKVDGKRTFRIKFPVSPKRLIVSVFNVDNGNLPVGEDTSFKVTDSKVEPLKEYDVWWNQDTKNFYKFAVEFAENAGILSAGNKEPDKYRSDDGKFSIYYFNRIYDRKAGKFLTTPARIGHNSGIIEVSKKRFLNMTVPMRLVVLLHEFAHKYLNPKIEKDISYETGADIQGLYVYLGKGWSPLEAHQAFLKVFEKANNKANHKRYKIIRDFIDKYDKGVVAKVKSASETVV